MHTYVVAVCLFAAPALAQPYHPVGFLDDCESYNTGALAGQGSWFASGACTFVDISFLDARLGDRTVRASVSSSSDRAIKLLGTGPAYGRLDFDLIVPTDGGGTVELIEGGSNRTVAFLAFRGSNFANPIKIRPSLGSNFELDSPAEYTPNSVMRIGMEVLPGGIANYYLDGELFYSGFDLSDVPEFPSIGFDEFELTNERFSSGSFYVDNLEWVSPATPPCSVADVTTTNTNPGDTGYGVGDGVIDGADISYYVEQWLAGVAAVADVTTINTNPGEPGYGEPDGSVDGADLAYFIEQWLAGCP